LQRRQEGFEWFEVRRVLMLPWTSVGSGLAYRPTVPHAR